MPKDYINSPTIRTTAGAASFARLTLDDRLDQDYAHAARLATKKQSMLEAAALQVGLSLDAYLRKNESIPSMLQSHPIHSTQEATETCTLVPLQTSTHSCS